LWIERAKKHAEHPFRHPADATGQDFQPTAHVRWRVQRAGRDAFAREGWERGELIQVRADVTAARPAGSVLS
jgi:hypothetical protein